MNPDRLVVVFTAKSGEQLLADGGSQAWVVSPGSMRDVKYAVCVRNSDRRFDEECGERTEPHNSAFFVGKIKGIRKVERLNDRDRYIIEFSEYATLEPILEYRIGSVRNPVTYSDVSHALTKGLDVDKLDFKPMPPRPTASSSSRAESDSIAEGLSIAEAKQGLARTFGVPVEAITITISG